MPLLMKSAYVHAFTAAVIFGTYGFWVFGVLGVNYFTGPDALIRTGKAIATLIVAGYAFEIFVTLAVLGRQSIQHARHGTAAIDERDRQILYKSLFASHHALCAGLFVSIGALALGAEAFWVFNAIVMAFLLSVVAELATKLFHYHVAT